MWIKRDLDTIWTQPSLPVRIIQGLRQSGKTSFLEHVAPLAEVARLDDLAERRLAQDDPALFFQSHAGRPLIIDEAQYAPNLFPEIKAQVDAARKRRRQHPESTAPAKSIGRNPSPTMAPMFLLSGSNQTLVHAEVRETLAGRAAFYKLHTLSIREILRVRPDYAVFEYFLRGGWPELHVDTALSERDFLNDYISTFLEKDIARSAGIAKLGAFERALGLLAARTGQQLNVAELAGQVGVDATTLKGWVSVLEQNLVVGVLQPYFSNLSKRLVKTPKIYFLEPSLASRLQGWTTLEPLLKSPSVGGLFETLVYGEIVRTIDHSRASAELYYLRTRDGDEIDFLVIGPNGRHLLLEAKLAVQATSSVQVPKEFAKILPVVTPLWVVTAGGRSRKLSTDCECVPIQELADRLEGWVSD